jgi:Flp pilus assembly protein TadG
MRSRRTGDDSGMATAELAACLPVLMLVVSFVMSVAMIGSAAVRAQDAAREAARAAARGDAVAAARLAREAAPGSTLSISSSAGDVTAVVQLRPHLLVPWLPPVTVTGRAVAASEPTVPP